MNILLTSAGRRTYLIDYFREAMKGVGLVFASNSEYTYSLSHADGYVVTPLIYEKNYIPFLLNYCLEHQITALMSLFDVDLYVLAENKDLFERNGIRVIVSNKEIISICNDKWKTYEFLCENNVSCPKTYCSLEDVLQALDSSEISFPVVVKPRWGMGSIGICVAENKNELVVFAHKVYNKIFNSYLKYESVQDLQRCVIFQEQIEGEECGLDVLNDFNSHLATVVAKKKISMRSGETDIAEIIDVEEFRNVAMILSEKLKHVANLDVDVFRKKDGKISVLELNCRFGGQYPFSHLAGVNFPKQIVRWLQGKGADPQLLRAKVGTKSCKDIMPVLLSQIT